MSESPKAEKTIEKHEQRSFNPTNIKLSPEIVCENKPIKSYKELQILDQKLARRLEPFKPTQIPKEIPKTKIDRQEIHASINSLEMGVK